MKKRKLKKSLFRLYQICKDLRGKNGCPWDKKQNPSKMRPYLQEEIYELIDAINENNNSHIKEELGDCFFNLILLATILEEENNFNLTKSLNDVSDKIIRRHPHVSFKEKKIRKKENPLSIEKINKQWDKIKEESEGRKKDFLLDDVPEGFPPLLKSTKFIKKAKKMNVDCSFNKSNFSIPENINKLNPQEKEEKLGKLFFELVKLCNQEELDPNIALERANSAFYEELKS